MRTRLPDRRPSLTTPVRVPMDGGKEIEITITVGFADREMREPREVFCNDFKAGTSLHAIVMDACILLSRCLQHGDHPAELARTCCQPPSLVGAIAACVAAQMEYPT